MNKVNKIEADRQAAAIGQFDFVILYVADVVLATAFYQDLLGNAPQMEMPGFAMFQTANGQMLGLQAADTAPPHSGVTGGGGELGVQLAANDEVDALHDAWAQRGINILETPNAKPYGYTFMAADPDRHRIRVYAPAPT